MKRFGWLVVLGVVGGGCMGGDDGPAAVVPSFLGSKYAGNYTGTWSNTTFASTGASKLTVTANDGTKTGTATCDLDGLVLGVSNPPAETFNGTFNDNGFTFSGTSAVFGTFMVTLAKDGTASGSATNLPNTNISRVDFNGTATPTAIHLNYTVKFSAAGGGGTAIGTVDMTKP